MSDNNEAPEYLRKIRSFVLRTGRMTLAQKKAYDEGWAQWGLNLEDGLIELESVFGRQAPLVLEIGYGMGKSLLEMSIAAPEKDFIGIEVHTPGVGKLLQGIRDAELPNMRSYAEDAVEVLDKCIPDQSLDCVQIFFPDPWHKKKHYKRRLVQAAFVEQLRMKLKLGGILHFATDWENYAEHMMAVMAEAPGFRNQAGAGEFFPRPDYRPITKFERRGERLGHGVWDMLFERTE